MFGSGALDEIHEWTDMLVPESIQHEYKYDEYREKLKKVQKRRQQLGIREPRDSDVLTQLKKE